MRILQVNSAKSFGGGETHVIQLVQGLRGLGHEVAVAGRAEGPLQPDIVLPFVNSADFLTALKLRRILREGQFDLVHARVARDYTVVAASAWGVKQVKVVFTRHLLYPVRTHVLYRRVDGWLAPTSQIVQTLAPLRPKRASVVPNWVDLQKFQFWPHELHNPINVALIGQISPHKGHDDAIEAMRMLGTRFRLLLAGTGNPEYVDAIKKKAAGLPIEFAGFVSLPELFEAVDVVVLPSWEEPFGIVLLEAMASGVPVVATAAGGPLEIITSGEQGLLVPPRNPAELAAAVRQVSENAALRRKFVHAARDRVEREFDMQPLIRRIDEFYRTL